MKKIGTFLISALISSMISLPVTAAQNQLNNAAYFLFGINERLEENEVQKNSLNLTIGELKKRLAAADFEITSVSKQLENLDKTIKETEEKRAKMRILMAEHRNRIEILKQEALYTRTAIDDLLAPFVSALKESIAQKDLLFDEQGESNLLAAFASSQSHDALLTEEEYRRRMQTAAVMLGRKLSDHQKALIKNRAELDERQNQLLSLEFATAQELATFEATREAKQRLLVETKGNQELYEALLEKSRRDAVNVAAEIERLRENYSFFEEKLAALKSNNEFGTSTPSVEVPASILSWPVSPVLGISAFFHDSAYEKALGLRHDAIDIRVTQGSEIKAAADGVISKVADNGMGYSYIIVSHPDSLMTLYGHVSQILVTEGQIVRRGETIGLSGGIPGTKGAGWLTTGAHLHLEVFKDFRQVDPLLYLPLELLPLKSLPEKYLPLLVQ